MPGRACMLVHEHFPRDFRVRREARALVQAGWQVTVVSLKRPGQPTREWIDGIFVVRLPIRRHRGSRLPVYLAEYLAFASVASATVSGLHLTNKFDVVHVHTPPDFLVAAALPARLAGARLVLDIHDLTPELYGSRFRKAGGRAARMLTERVEWSSCAVCDRVITATHTFKRQLVERGVAADKIVVLQNCPDPEIFSHRAGSSGKSGNNRFVVVHHGTLLHRYGQDQLIEAFALVSKEVPRARLEVFGNGDLMPLLRRLVESLALTGSVTLHGEVPQEQIARALAQADLCVVPNRADDFVQMLLPTKLLEALHMKCPVAAAGTREVASTFASGGVHMFTPGDPKAMAEAIIRLASDPEARQALAQEGFRQAKRFSWTSEKLKLLDLYSDLGGLSAT